MALPSKLYSAGRNLRRDTPQARKGTCYYADFRVDGIRHRPELGACSHAEALVRLADVMREMKAAIEPVVPATGPYKLREVQQALVEAKPRLALETVLKYRQADTRAREWFGEEVFIETLTREEIETWLEHRGEEVGAATQNRDLKRLRQVCQFATEKEWLDRNPTAGIPLYREPEADIIPLTQAELERLKMECEDWLWDMARFAMLTGLRRTEQLRLRFSQIYGDMIHLGAEDTKTKKSRKVVLSPAAVAILDRARVGNPSDIVFPTIQGKVWNPCNLMHDHWRPSVRAAGLEGVTWHRLRHEYCSRLIAAGIREWIVADLAGHSVRVLKRYAHLSPDFKRDVVKVLT